MNYILLPFLYKNLHCTVIDWENWGDITKIVLCMMHNIQKCKKKKTLLFSQTKLGWRMNDVTLQFSIYQCACSTISTVQICAENWFLKVCDRLKTPKMASGHYWKVQKNSTKFLQKLWMHVNSVYVRKNRASYYYLMNSNNKL